MTESSSKPPTRQERKRCWFLRDQYFGCLDKLNITDPTIVEKNPEKATECLELKKGYEEGCMASWVCTLFSEIHFSLISNSTHCRLNISINVVCWIYGRSSIWSFLNSNLENKPNQLLKSVV